MKKYLFPDMFLQKWLRIVIVLGGVIISSVASAQEFPFKAGETIVYDVKKFAKVGEATLIFKGPTTVNNQPAVLIVFTSRGMNFYDEEKIYLDPKTFYPIIVERDLNIWGKKEKIKETYDQAKGTVTVVKMVKGKETTQVLTKAPPIENLYGFIYHYRFQGKFQVGDKLNMRLPTKDVAIKLLQFGKLNVGAQSYDVAFMQSDSKEYNIWFERSGLKIPVRIDGAMGLGKTSMILKKYLENGK